MPRTSANWSFSRGIALNDDRIFLTSFPDSSGEPQPVTQVTSWSPARTASFMLPFEAKSIVFSANPEQHGILLGPFGEIFVSTSHGNSEESLSSAADGPARYGPMRDLRTIDGNVYAVGMNRQCYRRECGSDALASVVWARADGGVLNVGPPDPVVGFNSIDGFSNHDLYAVGWQGEIWHSDGKHWDTSCQPTNLKLERVVCAENGLVYAVGQSGVIVTGSGHQWEIVPQDLTRDQFWCAVWFQERLWLATRGKVYVLDRNRTLKEVDMGLIGNATCGWLTSSENKLWSIGSHHVLSTTDGEQWRQLFL